MARSNGAALDCAGLVIPRGSNHARLQERRCAICSFVINEVLESEKLYQTLPGYEEATEDLMNAIVEEGAKFAEEVVSPLNQSGDEEGCRWSEEGVQHPRALKKPTSNTLKMAGRR